MDNFDLRNFLAEGKLHENTEALSREEVVDIAQKIADEFSYEDAQEGGSSMVYMVGDVDGMRFELDTKATNRTPAEDAKYGTGEGWGGSFRIDVKPNGYEIRNTEKGGLVATMDMEDGFKMLSADESRAEMGLEENKEETKSNKMKKSELKEMIKMAMLEDARTDAEQEGYKDGFEDAKEDVEDALKKMKVSEAEGDMIPAEKLFALIARDLKFAGPVQDGVMFTKEQAIEIMRHVIAIEGSDISAEAALGEYIANGEFEEAGDIPGFEGTKDALDSLSLREEEEVEKDVDVDVKDDENIDVDIEKDVKVDDEEKEVDIDVKASISGENEDVEAVQGLLTKALEMSQALGDEKLEDQIGNTITYFTRAHVSRVNEMDINVDDASNTEMEAGLGLEEGNPVKEELTWYIEDENSEVFYNNDEYVKEVSRKIKELFPDISDEDLEKVIDMTGEQYAREEDFHGDNLPVSWFVTAAEDIYQVNFLDLRNEEVKESLNESVMFPMWNKIK